MTKTRMRSHKGNHPSRRCASGGQTEERRRGMPTVAAVAQDTRRQVLVECDRCERLFTVNEDATDCPSCGHKLQN